MRSIINLFLICFSILFFQNKIYSQVIDEKIVDLNVLEKIVLSKITDNNIFVLTKHVSYLPGDLYQTKFFKLSNYDLDFNLVNQIEIDNIEINDTSYQYLPFKFDFKNDTLILYSFFVEQKQDLNYYGHDLSVLKFYNNEEVFRNYSVANDLRGPSTGIEILNHSINKDKIYVTYKSLEIYVREYSTNGDYIKTQVMIDDSISIGQRGNPGEKYDFGIFANSENIYLFISEIESNPQKYSNYIYIYDINYEFIKRIVYDEKTRFNGILNFKSGSKDFILFDELIYNSNTIVDRPSWHLFEIYNDSLVNKNISFGINYSDNIYYISEENGINYVIGEHSKIPNKPNKTTLLQLYDSNFNLIQNKQIYSNESDEANYGISMKVINENELIIVGTYTSNRAYYLLKIDKTLKVKDDIKQNKLVYPNPTTGEIFIENILNGSEYKIYNLFGNEITNGKYIDKINIKYLSNGVYFVYINGEIFKFIKD